MMRRRERCPECGVSLPDAVGRCPTCGHDVESVAVVNVGDEPGPLPTDGRRRRSRSRPIAVAVVAVAAAIVAALALVDRSADPDAETAATATTARPTTTTDAGPRRGAGESLLGEPTGIRLGIVGRNGLQVFDLDTGEHLSEFRAVFTTIGEVVVPRADGVVVLVTGVATYFPDLAAGDAVEPVALGLAQGMYASDDAGRVWLLEGAPFGSRPVTLSEVDLTGEVVAGPIQLPSDAAPVGPAADGLIVNSPDGIFHIGRYGGVRRVAQGVALGARGASVVHRACDDRLQCAVYVTDIVSGSARLVPGTEATVGDTFSSALRPDGAALAAFSLGPQELVVIDLADGAVLHRSQSQLRNGSGLAWSPDGAWLFWPEFAGAGALHLANGELLQLDVPTGFELVAFGSGG